MSAADRHRGIALIVAAAFALASGCASVPTGGRVDSRRSVERAEPIDDPYVRQVPVPPRDDWLPTEIITGFLVASSNFDDGHKVAHQYLAKDVQWTPGPRPTVTVYKGEVDELDVGQGKKSDTNATVTVTGDQLGKIDKDGQYTAAPESRLKMFIDLVKDARGRWRISRLPPELRKGLLLSKSDVDRAFRPFYLYFFRQRDPGVLVPNGIFLPLVNRQNLARQLVEALLVGPTEGLRPAVETFFPPGTRLKSVDLSNDVATIDLNASARGGDTARMSAQLSWTLERLPEAKHIKVQIEGKTITPEGADVGPVQSSSDWRTYNPDFVNSGAQEKPAYVRGQDNRLSKLTDGQQARQGTQGQERLWRPAIAVNSAKVAGLNEKGDQLLSGDLAGGANPVHEILHRPGSTFTPPSWDRDDTLWTVERRDSKSTLWAVREGTTPKQVAFWDLQGSVVLAFRVARDGVRAAAIVKTGNTAKLQIGRIVHEKSGEIKVDYFQPISSELVDVYDVAWADSTTLAALGKTQPSGQVTPYSVPVSGSGITTIGTGTLGKPVSIAAAPKSPILLGSQDGKERICRQRDPNDRFSEWDCALPGADPAYRG